MSILTFLLGVASGIVWLTGVVGRWIIDAIDNEVMVKETGVKEENIVLCRPWSREKSNWAEVFILECHRARAFKSTKRRFALLWFVDVSLPNRSHHSAWVGHKE